VPINYNSVKKEIMKKQFTLLALLFLFVQFSFAQETPRFWDDVQTIKNYDKIYQPNKNPILFVGSSSIRKWDHLQEAFGNYNVINRGIGGAVIDDIIFYVDDLVFKYQPREIVIYVGENDLPNEKETPEIILDKTKQLFNTIRAKLPDVPIVYIALKPSPVRAKYLQKCKESNDLIASFIKAQKNASFLDVYSLMMKDGKTMPEIFVGDMLHMNLTGYKIWEKAIKPYLIKNED
jgi:lysophospholipase L1-like esterase